MADRSNSEILRDFGDGLTDRQTYFCYSKVAFATEKIIAQMMMSYNMHKLL